MKYHYRVEIVSNASSQIEKLLNDLGKAGYKLFYVQPLNTITGVTLHGLPKNEVSYQLIFEKVETDGTS